MTQLPPQRQALADPLDLQPELSRGAGEKLRRAFHPCPPASPITRQQEAESLDHLHDLPSPRGRGAGGKGFSQTQKGA